LSIISEKQYQTPADLARDCRVARLGSGGDIGAVDRLDFLGS
jgi:hypothetical protein